MIFKEVELVQIKSVSIHCLKIFEYMLTYTQTNQINLAFSNSDIYANSSASCAAEQLLFLLNELFSAWEKSHLQMFK